MGHGMKTACLSVMLALSLTLALAPIAKARIGRIPEEEIAKFKKIVLSYHLYNQITGRPEIELFSGISVALSPAVHSVRVEVHSGIAMHTFKRIYTYDPWDDSGATILQRRQRRNLTRDLDKFHSTTIGKYETPALIVFEFWSGGSLLDVITSKTTSYYESSSGHSICGDWNAAENNRELEIVWHCYPSGETYLIVCTVPMDVWLFSYEGPSHKVQWIENYYQSALKKLSSKAKLTLQVKLDTGALVAEMPPDQVVRLY